jgi:hypothetical protein
MNVPVRYLSTTLAMVLAAIVWIGVLDRPEPPRPPRPALAATALRPQAPVVPPTARDLLAEADTLGLTASQRARLAALESSWDREARALEAEVNVAADAFARFMAEAQQHGRASVDEIRRRSIDYQELSAALRERRARHGREALDALTAEQRALVAGRNQIAGGTR